MRVDAYFALVQLQAVGVLIVGAMIQALAMSSRPALRWRQWGFRILLLLQLSERCFVVIEKAGSVVG